MDRLFIFSLSTQFWCVNNQKSEISKRTFDLAYEMKNYHFADLIKVLFIIIKNYECKKQVYPLITRR